LVKPPVVASYITATAWKDPTADPDSGFTARGVVDYDLTVPMMGRILS
jgi:hypothetical protein